jgi:acetylornithine/succinyldiaminopimelate/putrescine aminotransferase
MPQLAFAELLLKNIGDRYQSVYYLSTGTEAIELAMKIAKKATGRYQIIACRNAYHGSTHGAESLRSDIEYKNAFLPLVPGVKHITFNIEEDISQIDDRTAAVIMEPVQAEAGIVPPIHNYLKAVEKRCSEVGALFILDEIQTGFGRTGKLFAHQKYDVTPDLFTIGKAMGAGMPLSGVVGPKHLLNVIVSNPELGHITTFGGHALSCAAANAGLEVLLKADLINEVVRKESLFKKYLQHDLIKEVRSSGLMMAVELKHNEHLTPVISKAFENGILIDYFLFNNNSFRLAPPLIISNDQIKEACERILKALDQVNLS